MCKEKAIKHFYSILFLISSYLYLRPIYVLLDQEQEAKAVVNKMVLWPDVQDLIFFSKIILPLADKTNKQTNKTDCGPLGNLLYWSILQPQFCSESHITRNSESTLEFLYDHQNYYGYMLVKQHLKFKDFLSYNYSNVFGHGLIFQD